VPATFRTVDGRGEATLDRQGSEFIAVVVPVDTVEALPEDEMQDEPYKSWFKHTSTSAGDDVARSVADTGCSL